MKCLGSKATNPIMVELTINGQKTKMELDTGAAVSVISTQTKTEMFPQASLMPSTLILTTYTGEQLEVAGQLMVEVRYGRQVEQLPLYVVKGKGPSLMGRNWLHHIKLNWQSLKLASLPDTKAPSIDWQKQIEALLQTYKNVFVEELGQMKTFEATLQLKPGAKPKFCKAWPVPFALKAAIDRELDRLDRIRGNFRKGLLQ